ncbi:hypothetical protein J2858_001552 [Neorhizobium galegae]|uniref:hypothetical protein n=1 Tax=Neorhizobium galegae TaxID=399 RepID=UPI001AE88C65|nr:hypothetical protein [Neorhizobium galegae]MBP2548636.1 hypothetical protein [Neorhizobium galegae]
MTAQDNQDARDKMKDEGSRRFSQDDRERAEDALQGQVDKTNLKAQQEASRLGGDVYLVKSDLEDQDERMGEDQLDGRPSPMANADNPER